MRGRRVIAGGAPATCDVAALRKALGDAYPRVRSRADTDPAAHPYTKAAEVEYRRGGNPSALLIPVHRLEY